MLRAPRWFLWHPSRATLIATGLVILGMALTEVSWWFLVLVGLGALGPGALRELGWLKDKDEYQLRAAQRAGYHAFLIGGFVAVLLTAYFRTGERQIKDAQSLADLFLVLLWCTWLFSSLFAYWGAKRTAVRILVIFGTFWLLFVVAESLGERASLLGFVMHSLPALPFFLLAFLGCRWPRAAGAALMAAAAFFVYFFGWYKVGAMGFVNQTVTMIIFIGPLVASGLALMASRAGEAKPDAPAA
jgi:hypothetical protein